MGGNAIKHVRRIGRDEYNEICMELIQLFSTIHMVPVRTFKQKKDFGDIDFIVETQPTFNITEHIKNRLTLQKEDYYDNGPVFSFRYKDIQIDFNYVSSDGYEMMYNWHGDGDLSNFIGRTSRALNFKYSQKGLCYELRLGGHHKKSIVISNKIEKILPFLGYDYDIWLNGFDDEQSIFEYVASSPFFNPSYFTLEEQ